MMNHKLGIISNIRIRDPWMPESDSHLLQKKPGVKFVASRPVATV